MFTELFDTAPDAMIAVDRNGNIVRINAQAERLFGYSEAELRDCSIEVLVPKGARAAHVRHRTEYSASPRVRPMGAGQDLVGLRRDGATFPVEIALSPVNTSVGPVVVASIRDISESQRARQALARARYDTLVNEIGELVLTTPNQESTMQRASQTIAEALCLDAVAIVFTRQRRDPARVRVAFGLSDRQFDDLLGALSPADTAGSSRAAVGSCVVADCGSAEAPEVAVRLHDLGYGAAVIVPLGFRGDAIGQLAALSRVARDFDHDEVHFLESTARLLGAATQRARILEQLAHAQRLEAVGQLTGGVAHDFNNLLTIISGNLQILESELEQQPHLHEPIGSALRAVGRGAELTRKLLAFARRQRLSPVAIDPASLLTELNRMLRRTLGEAIALDIECPAGTPPVFADPAQIEAALVNLALNARDAMPRGGRLQISADRYEHGNGGERAEIDLESGRYVVFTVRDTGTGMPPDVLERAFEPFFTTKEASKGSGLGLSMVYGFVRQSGGDLNAQSQPGEGTRIALYLPVADAGPQAQASSPAPPASAGNPTVLVVEDEAEVRNIATRFLQSAGYIVLAAANAESALRLIEQTPDIALLFTDLVLGKGMNGAELGHAAQAQRPTMRVLLTSGYESGAADADAATGSGHGFPLLPKPYRRNELLDAVAAVLEPD